MHLYKVTDLELYLSEVGDGDPDLQYTPQEQICEFIGYPVEYIEYEIRG